MNLVHIRSFGTAVVCARFIRAQSRVRTSVAVVRMKSFISHARPYSTVGAVVAEIVACSHLSHERFLPLTL